MGNQPSGDKSAMAQVLSEVSLFSFLSDAETLRLADFFRGAKIAPGTPVVTQGSPGRDFYVIADGTVWTEVDNGVANQQLAQKRKYDFFGELALVSNGTLWSTTMRAGPGGCMLLVLTQARWEAMSTEFERVHERLCKLAQHTMGSVLRRISVFNGIPNSNLGVLSTLLNYHMVNQGSIICREGSFGDSMYIIAEGAVKIIAEGTDRCARDVRCQGFLIKKGGAFGTWRRRYFKLANNKLTYYACDEEIAPDPGTGAQPKRRNHRRRSSGFQSAKKFLESLEGDTSIMVSSVEGARVSTMGHAVPKELVRKGEVEVKSVTYFNKKPNGFEIATSGKTLYVCADSPAHREEWISCLNDGMHASQLNEEEAAAAAAGSGATAAPSSPGATKLRKGATAVRAATRFGNGARRGSRGSVTSRGSRGSMADEAKDEPAPDPIVATLRAGSYFGEIALVAQMPRTATVMAQSKCTLLELKKENFQNFLAQMPDDVRTEIELLVRQRTATNLSTLNLPFLAGFSPARLNLIANCSVLRHLAPGEAAINQGDIGDSFYIILHGEAEVVIKASDGMESVVNVLASGEYFGEVALLTDAPRLATVRATKRTTLLQVEKITFLDMFAMDSKEALADFELKVVQRNAELSHVIAHPVGLRLFTKQLQKEYSAENINFWKAVQEFRDRFATPVPSASGAARECVQSAELGAAAKTASDILNAAQQIHTMYIGDAAPEQINIPDDVRAELDERVESGDADEFMFDQAQEEIYKLMESDNYARFKKSELFEELMTVVNPYEGDAVQKADSATKMARRSTARRASHLASVREVGQVGGSGSAATAGAGGDGVGAGGAGAGSGTGAATPAPQPAAPPRPPAAPTSSAPGAPPPPPSKNKGDAPSAPPSAAGGADEAPATDGADGTQQ